MTRTRKLIIGFWVVIILLLLWQFHDYNQGLEKKGHEEVQQQHFFFVPTNAGPQAPPKPVHEGAYVEQIAYNVQRETPGAGSFTCNMTLKNTGTSLATSVQGAIYPFRGTRLGDPDNGHSDSKVISDTDARSNIVQWVNFPDLAPGQSETESAVFIDQEGLN